MKALDFTILYVASPANSAAFYQRILNVDAVELSPTFAMFILPSGGRLGLWIASGVTPPVSAGTSQSEIVFTAESRDEVDNLFNQWQAWGVEIPDPPATLDFGYTFTACDPDGHRLRVYVYEE